MKYFRTGKLLLNNKEIALCENIRISSKHTNSIFRNEQLLTLKTDFTITINALFYNKIKKYSLEHLAQNDSSVTIVCNKTNKKGEITQLIYPNLVIVFYYIVHSYANGLKECKAVLSIK